MGKLNGKVALVTGGNKGIGKAIARGLAAEGAALVLTARGADALQRTADELTAQGAIVLAVPADVTSEREVESLFRRTVERFGRLDILVNNAGAFDGGPIDELSIEAWDKVIAVNLRAPFLCTREAMRLLKKQADGGKIINIGSISAQRVRPGSAAYSASKHAIWGLTQVTALEGRPFNIACGCLHPGNTLVERRQGSTKKEDDEPMMTADELAQAAVLMATMPPHVNFLEAIVLPVGQQYIGRG
jgi:NAD(P)-dependent dehydrogenase (short-subunit alcohol dehydrogenase family)